MYKLIPIAILLAIISCKKSGEKTEPTTAVTVREYRSNSPIANATVSFSRQSLTNGSTTLFTGYTNEEGICQVPTKYYNEPGAYMNVSAAKYWPFYFSHVGNDVALLPMGWIRVLDLQNPAHVDPYASFINLYLVTQSSGGGPFQNLYPVGTESVLLPSVGGDTVAVAWQTLNSNNDTLNRGEERNVIVPKLDTIDIIHLSGY